MNELSAYLDDETDADIRAKLEKHTTECPNCWVVCDTTKKTIKVYKGMQACAIPESVHARLMEALERKMAAAKVNSEKGTAPPYLEIQK